MVVFFVGCRKDYLALVSNLFAFGTGIAPYETKDHSYCAGNEPYSMEQVLLYTNWCIQPNAGSN
jgi:hypothetical protein